MRWLFAAALAACVSAPLASAADAPIQAVSVMAGSRTAERFVATVPVTFHPPQERHGGWRPQIPLDVTPLPWMLAAQAETVTLTAGGEGSAARFELLSRVAGTTIN